MRTTVRPSASPRLWGTLVSLLLLAACSKAKAPPTPPVPVKVALAERQCKTKFVERQLRYDMGDFNLIGRLDRVDEYPDGTLEIVDYKTGRETVSEEDVAGDLAMSIYQLLLHKKHPDRPIRARIEAVRTGISATAALNPADGPWIYYVLQDAEGHHLFTDSNREFINGKQRCAELGLGCG